MTAPIRQLGQRPDRAVTRCPGCGRDVLVWFRTDGNGRLLEEAERCGCGRKADEHRRGGDR